jgi:hypothetical protein
MTAADLATLHGRIVLVKSARDHHYPETGMRGTIEVPNRDRDEPPRVQIALEFPQMFETPAHHRTIVLDPRAVDRLIASEYNGTYEITLDEPLDDPRLSTQE